MGWLRRRRAEKNGPARLSIDELIFFNSQARPAASLLGAKSVDGGSYLGGCPVLGDSQWPTWDGRPLSFLACIDLSDFVGIDVGLALPASGTLSFFYEAEDQQAWGFDPAHRDGWRDIHTPNVHAEPTEAPDGALTFQQIPLDVVPLRTLPGWQEPVVGALRESNWDGFLAKSDELEQPSWPEATQHQVGGWPVLQQGPLWEEAQLASNGIYLGGPDGHSGPRAAWLRRGNDSWRLLLQLDTDDRAGWMWGDVGMLYFLIQEQDLVDGRFERVWMIFQCG